MERDEEMKKSWMKLEEDVGLIVVDDDEVEQEEEDREVERILVKGKESKNSSNNTVQYSTVHIRIHYTYVEHVKQFTLPYIFSCENCGSRAQDDCGGVGDVWVGGGGSRDWWSPSVT